MSPRIPHLIAGACGAWLVVLALGGPSVAAQRGQGSPAAQPLPPTATPQQFSPALVEEGRGQFASRCGFCHGRDAAGGAGGSDLTRSAVVAADMRGNRIGPVVRSGRPEQGMPAFALTDAELAGIVAFIHDQKAKAESLVGGRRSVDVADVSTGNAAAGRAYFATSCARCHSATGDLSGIASRMQGLTLLQRMLYSGSEGRGGGPPPRPPMVTVTLPSGQIVTGRQAYRDEFTIALTDADGWYRSWPTSRVRFTVDDPLQAHVDQLARYTDADMHDVLAYLHTLR